MWDASCRPRLACTALALLLAACGGGGDAGGGGGGGTPNPPALGLTVNPTAVAFAAPQNGPLPPAQSVQVTLTRADVFVVTARFAPSVSAPTWLPSTPQLTGSGANWTLNGGVVTTALEPGTYTTIVRVEAKDTSQAVLAFSDVQVSYTIQSPGSLSANPSGLTFSQIKGAPTPAPQSVDISDPAGGSFAWSASIIYQSGSGWLNVNAGSTASGASLPASLNVTVNPLSSTGTVSATIRVTWIGSTLDIPVMYTVSDPLVTPASLSLSFSALRLAPTPATKDITLNTQSGIPVPFTTAVTYGTGATGWLNAPATGTAPGAATVGVNTTTLAPGTYAATLKISTASQAFVITVTYNVSEPLITPSTTFSSFFALRLGPTPSTQDITLTTQGGISVPFTTSVTFPSTGGWLTVPASGSAPGPLTIGVNATTLAPGAYFATLSLRTGTQVYTISVTYNVNDPLVTPSANSLNFSALRFGPTPATQDITLTTQNSIPVPFTTTVLTANPGGWLTPAASGTAPTTLTVGVNTTALAPATYAATVRITTAGQVREVTVNYSVSEPTVTQSATSLVFSALRLGPAPATQDVTFTTQNGISVPFTTSVTYFGGSGWLTVPATGTAPGTLTVGVNTTTLAPGVYFATLAVNTAARTISINVTFVVSEPTLSRSPQQLTFNAPSTGTLPAIQDVTLSTEQGVRLGYSTSIVYGGGASGWLSAPASGTAPGPLTLGVNTTALLPGTYTANIAVFTAAQTVQISITYIVGTSALTFSPTTPSFLIDTNSLPAALNQSVGVGTTGVALSWTAASSQPWLTVSPASGTSGTSVTFALVPAQLDVLDSGQRSATVTFSYTPPPNQAPISTPLSVSLDLQIPKVTSVHPYVATSGTSLEVILRGSGFSSTAGNPASFGGSLGSNQTVVSDTELRVMHPSLTAGSYSVRFPSNLGSVGIVRSTANLVVVDAPAFTATTIAYPAVPAAALPRIPVKIVYDAERKALVVAVQYSGTGTVPDIHRYASSGSAWSTLPTTVPVPNMGDLAPTLNGKKLLVTSGATLKELDLATLASGVSTIAPLLVSDRLDRLAVANDGNAIVSTELFGNCCTETFRYSVADRVFSLNPSFLGLPNLAGSADASLLVITQNGIFPSQAVYLYNASTSTLGPTTLELNINSPILDRRGTRIAIGGSSIYDRNLQLLGSVGGVQALSPDGLRAYAADHTLLHTYDLSGTPPAGLFQEILPAKPLPGDPGANPVVTVSPDGSTLFIAGTERIVVIPAP